MRTLTLFLFFDAAAVGADIGSPVPCPQPGLPWAPPIQFCPCGPACGCVGLGYPACGSPGCPAAAVSRTGPIVSPAAGFVPQFGGNCAGGQCGVPQSYQPARGFIRRW